jgi:hypothetical protein
MYVTDELLDEMDAPETGGRIVLEDGTILDAETGEIVGMADAPPATGMTERDAVWVLKRMLGLDARAASADAADAAATAECEAMTAAAMDALQQTPEWIAAEAVRRNAAAVRERAQKTRAYLEGLYAQPLAGVAARMALAGERSWATPYGTVSVRRKPARLEVADPEAAMAWARECGWDAAVKTKTTFLISGVPKAEKAALLDDPDAAAGAGLTVIPAADQVTILTHLPAPVHGE